MRRLDPFHALPQAERAAQLCAHREAMRLRDGEIDLSRARLPERERFFAHVDARPVRWRGDLDRDALQRHRSTRPPADVDARALWILAAAKANEGESYGVELERFAARTTSASTATCSTSRWRIATTRASSSACARSSTSPSRCGRPPSRRASSRAA